MIKITKISLERPYTLIACAAMILCLGSGALFSFKLSLFPTITASNVGFFAGNRHPNLISTEKNIAIPIENIIKESKGVEWQKFRVTDNYVSGEIQLKPGIEPKDFFAEFSRGMSQWKKPEDTLGPMFWLKGSVLLGRILITPKEGANLPEKWMTGDKRYIRQKLRFNLLQVPGITGLSTPNIDYQINILLDPNLLAKYQISLATVKNLLSQMKETSIGAFQYGDQKLRAQMETRLTIEQLEKTLIPIGKALIALGELATIEVSENQMRSYDYLAGKQAMAISIFRDPNSNLFTTLKDLQQALDRLEKELLAPHQLEIQHTLNITQTLHSATLMVVSSLFTGILLATLILWFFLRQWSSTLLAAISIPTSILLSLTILAATGHSLNLISLAGVAFASGMVLDAAIVVIESMSAEMSQHRSPKQAILTGTQKVMPALIASTITTIVIFLPILWLPGTEGQLFADLAITISGAVVCSFFVSITLVPLIKHTLLNRMNRKKSSQQVYLGPLTNSQSQSVWTRWSQYFLRFSNSNKKRLFIFSGVALCPIFCILVFPKLDFLPEIPTNAAFAVLNKQSSAPLREEVDLSLKPIMDRIQTDPDRNLWAESIQVSLEENAIELTPILKDISYIEHFEAQAKRWMNIQEKDQNKFYIYPWKLQMISVAPVINIYFSHPDPRKFTAIRAALKQYLEPSFPGMKAQLINGKTPENLTLTIDDQALADLQIPKQAVSDFLNWLGHGILTEDVFIQETPARTYLKTNEKLTLKEMLNTPFVFYHQAHSIPLTQLVKVEKTQRETSYIRYQGQRVLDVSIQPKQSQSLEETLEQINFNVESLRQYLPLGTQIQYTATADKLLSGVNNLGQTFLIAILILFFVLSALFQSFKDGLLVTITLPLATCGGLLGFYSLSYFTGENLNLLSLIGFLILLGIVVNNAILIIDRTRAAQSHGDNLELSLQQALSERLRPILMSTLTTVLGMLPLILLPSSGAVIYRGLAAIIASGMLTSTFFLLFLMPALLRTTIFSQAEAKNHSEYTPIKEVCY